MIMKFEIQFNDTVNNAHKVIREAQHMNAHAETKSWITKVGDYLDDLNFKIDFIEDIDKEDWLHANLLNLLDQLLCTKNKMDEKTDDYRVINSVYDLIRDFYFS